MKKIFSAFALSVVFFISSSAQLTFPPDGDNKKAIVAERIGITDIKIEYSRPAVKGREGKIWGQLVHKGYRDLGFGTSNAAPWRAGANECTTFEVSTDVTVQGKKLAAGKYGFFIAFDSTECTLIFSKNNTAWGSFFYDPNEDALKVTTKPVKQDRVVERLKYEFSDQTETSSVVSLIWEKLAIPFKVEVDLLTLQVQSLRKELQTEKGFTTQAWQLAAQWCADNNTNLEEALQWAEKASGIAFPGDRNFNTLATKSVVLELLNRKEEAAKVMNEAFELGTVVQIVTYARQLIASKKPQDALSLLLKNYEKNPANYISLIGLARGYAANGNFPKAIEFAEKAAPLASTPQQKSTIERIIALLKQGKDIN